MPRIYVWIAYTLMMLFVTSIGFVASAVTLEHEFLQVLGGLGEAGFLVYDSQLSSRAAYTILCTGAINVFLADSLIVSAHSSADPCLI